MCTEQDPETLRPLALGHSALPLFSTPKVGIYMTTMDSWDSSPTSYSQNDLDTACQRGRVHPVYMLHMAYRLRCDSITRLL